MHRVAFLCRIIHLVNEIAAAHCSIHFLGNKIPCFFQKRQFVFGFTSSNSTRLDCGVIYARGARLVPPSGSRYCTAKVTVDYLSYYKTEIVRAKKIQEASFVRKSKLIYKRSRRTVP